MIKNVYNHKKGITQEMGKVKDIRSGLKTLMEKKGREINPLGSKLQQTQLAEATGIPQGTISNWERDVVTRFDKHTLLKLMQYFDCDITDLLIVEREK